MLFACLKRQRVRAPAAVVLARADETTGDLSKKRFSTGEQSGSHPVCGRQSQRRGVPDDDVGSDVGRPLQKRECDRIRSEDEQRIVVGGQTAEIPESLFDGPPNGRRFGVHEQRVAIDSFG